MLLFRKYAICALFPAIVNGLIVGLELYLAFELPYLISALSVFIGEFVVVYIFGLPIYYILKKINFEEIYFKEIQN